MEFNIVIWQAKDEQRDRDDDHHTWDRYTSKQKRKNKKIEREGEGEEKAWKFTTNRNEKNTRWSTSYSDKLDIHQWRDEKH